MLINNENSVIIEGQGFKKFFVSLVADEQSLSQSTFYVEDNSGQYLMGLDQPLTAGKFSCLLN